MVNTFSIWKFRLGILEYLSRNPVFSGNFPFGKTKIGLPFTFQPKFPDFLDKWGVFHLPRNSGNSGWDVNGTHVFGSFHWKISGINGTSEKIVLFSRWKLSDGNVFHLQLLKGLTTSRLFTDTFLNFGA